MARIARVVAPGLPHHITTQRGNRHQHTFFTDDDYPYIDLMGNMSLLPDVETLSSYCRSAKAGGPDACYWGSSSPVYPPHQFSEGLERAFVAGAGLPLMF